MVKGLVAGLRTLLLAFALLFAVLYVISGPMAAKLSPKKIKGVNSFLVSILSHLRGVPVCVCVFSVCVCVCVFWS